MHTSFTTTKPYHYQSDFIKVYPTHTKWIQFNKDQKVRDSGWIERNNNTKNTETSILSKETNLQRSLRKTKTTLKDLILSNSFDMFITLTIKQDRQNNERSKKKIQTWLKNTKAKYGTFSYVIVPEFHKDKKSLHFHMLTYNLKTPLKKTNKRINSRPVYHLKTYKSGLNSVILIEHQNTTKLATYVTKYITKDMPVFNNKKRFWCSSGLKRPITLPPDYIVHNPFLTWHEVYRNKKLIIFNSPDTIQIPTNERIKNVR